MQRPHNPSRQRPILAAIATLGLLGALFGIAVPALAGTFSGANTLEDYTGGGPQGNPCGALTAYKIDEESLAGDDASHTYTAEDGEGNILFSVDIQVTAREDDVEDPLVIEQASAIAFTNASPAVSAVYTKAGSVNQTPEGPYEAGVVDEGGTSGTAGPRGDQGGISHIVFCLSGDTTGGGTSTPTEVATTTPTEFPTTTPTGTPGGTGGELGGQSGGGQIPNTSAESFSVGQIVTALSILLVVGSIAALAIPSLARRTNR